MRKSFKLYFTLALVSVLSIFGITNVHAEGNMTITNKEYVKTAVFPREIGRKIAQAEEIRHASDYDDFYIASKEESEQQISVADEFIILAEKYCLEQFKQ